MSVKVCYVDVLCTLRSPLLHLSKKKKKEKKLAEQLEFKLLGKGLVEDEEGKAKSALVASQGCTPLSEGRHGCFLDR